MSDDEHAEVHLKKSRLKALKKELNQGRPVLTLEYIGGETVEDYIRTAQNRFNYVF